ncbi:hypothetical protein SAMN05216344_102242 [Polaromonas sp. OV174]|nr:hypothetical protein SAMN05216344_102242 [Polaromonas sp. OV174]
MILRLEFKEGGVVAGPQQILKNLVTLTNEAYRLLEAWGACGTMNVTLWVMVTYGV